MQISKVGGSNIQLRDFSLYWLYFIFRL